MRKPNPDHAAATCDVGYLTSPAAHSASSGISLLFALLTGVTLSAAPLEVREAVRARVDAEYPSLAAVYRHLHANPELSFMEVKTAELIARELRSLGFEVTEKVGNTGVVAVLKNGLGPTVLVRADMDALPVKQTSGVPYASTAIARAAGVPEDRLPVVTITPEGTEPLINDTALTRRLAGVFTEWLGAERVKEVPAITAAEDFTFSAEPRSACRLSSGWWVGPRRKSSWRASALGYPCRRITIPASHPCPSPRLRPPSPPCRLRCSI